MGLDFMHARYYASTQGRFNIARCERERGCTQPWNSCVATTPR
jgi:hypothetical protein